MFLRLMSPKGGKKLSWLGFGEHKPEHIVFHNRDTGEPVIIQDYYCLNIGYAANDIKKGEMTRMKYSDCKELYLILKKEFGKG